MSLDDCPEAPHEVEESSAAILRPAAFPLWQKVLGMGLAYYAGAEGGRFLSPQNTSFVTFWLPGGLYVSALLLNPFRTWPWFMLMALLANLVFNLSHGDSLTVTVCFFGANTIHAATGAWLVRRFVAERLTLATMRELLGFLGFVCIVSAMLGALAAAMTLTTAGLSQSFFQSWRIWWGSNAMAVLTLSPFILIWFSKSPSMSQYLNQRKRAWEAAICFTGLLLTTWWFLLHGGGITVPNKAPVLLFLLWAGLRLGVRSIVAANFMVSVLFTYLTIHFHKGLAPADLQSGDYIFYLQAQVAVACLVGLVPALVLQEHDETVVALRVSEERYRTVVEFSPQGVAVVLDDRFAYLNPSGARMFGVEAPADILGRLMFDFTLPSQIAALKERRRQVMERRLAAPPAEFSLLRADGSTLRVISQAVPFVYESRQAVLYLLWDVHERKRLEEREHWRSRILESLAAGRPLTAVLELIVRSVEAEDAGSMCSILLLDEQGRHLLNGAGPSLPDAFNQALHAQEIGEGRGACATAAATGERVVTADILTHRSWEHCQDLARLGNVRSCWSEPILSSSGQVLGTFAIYHRQPASPGAGEIQLIKYAANLASLAIERKRADEALLRSEFRYRTLFESAQDAIFMMRGEIFVSCNPNSLKLFGCTLEQIVGQTPMRFSPENQPEGQTSAAKIREKIQAVIFGVPQRFEWRHRRLDGTEFDAEVSLNRMDLDEQPLVLAVVRDITERKQAEQRLQNSREQLRALSARLRSLREEERAHLAREIHDHLGQLLTALTLDLRLIERRAANVSDAALRESLTGKARSAQILADETITSVQKIASELRPAILDRLGLEAAIEVEAQLFQERTGVECHCTMPEIPIAATQDEATAIFRIFQEILTNVARHARAKNLTVNLSQQDETLQLEVEDDGVGIKPEEIADPASLGILGMQERAAILGGDITLGGGVQSGTRVVARVALHGKVGQMS